MFVFFRKEQKFAKIQNFQIFHSNRQVQNDGFKLTGLNKRTQIDERPDFLLKILKL